MPDATTTDRCPGCRSAPGDATAALAPGQAVCTTPDCPVVSWRTDTPRAAGVGSYLPPETCDSAAPSPPSDRQN